MSRERMERFRVKLGDLSWRCEPEKLPFRTTEELRLGDRIIGQEKALKALALGTSLPSPGYNLFVCGLSGTGRWTAVRRVLSRYRRKDYRPVDLSYVPNFDVPERPRLLSFPAGTAGRFRRDVEALLSRVERTRAASAPADRRRAIAELVEGCLPGLIERQPGEAAADHLRRLGRAIIESEGARPADELGVNVISEPSTRLPPVVMPASVSYGTLFGFIDRQGFPVSKGFTGRQGSPPSRTAPPEEPRAGHPSRGSAARRAPHACVRPGAVIEAAGGVLVLPAAELIAQKGCFSALKSCLEHRRLELLDIDPQSGNPRSGLRPEAIPLELKVILVGDYTSYDWFLDEDPDFLDLFKVRVDFDSEVELTPRLVKRDYPGFIARVIHDERLRHFSAEAVARVIEFAVRRAGRKNKITTQFSIVADVVREASFWAGRDESGRAAADQKRLVRAPHVRRALRESLDRLNLVETKIAEMIAEGTILIDTSGSRVGQVNGLAMYDQGDYIFGKPSRITAETSVGQGGIINIERESGFSGRSHDKGIQILGGYLRSRFAQRRPLSLTASVCFEQSYSGVDGDSASSTEIYAILSSLSGLPIRQDLAVTGSMNQKGDIQPIGGVNEKIEGFYDCVVAGRPTGREGVIIPRRNIPELMLRDDVLDAVRRGRFHVYAIRTVEEGIEILTGVPAGRPRKNGGYAAATVFGRADRRLEEIAHGLRRAANEPEN